MAVEAGGLVGEQEVLAKLLTKLEQGEKENVKESKIPVRSVVLQVRRVRVENFDDHNNHYSHSDKII